MTVSLPSNDQELNILPSTLGLQLLKQVLEVHGLDVGGAHLWSKAWYLGLISILRVAASLCMGQRYRSSDTILCTNYILSRQPLKIQAFCRYKILESCQGTGMGLDVRLWVPVSQLLCCKHSRRQGHIFR